MHKLKSQLIPIMGHQGTRRKAWLLHSIIRAQVIQSIDSHYRLSAHKKRSITIALYHAQAQVTQSIDSHFWSSAHKKRSKTIVFHCAHAQVTQSIVFRHRSTPHKRRSMTIVFYHVLAQVSWFPLWLCTRYRVNWFLLPVISAKVEKNDYIVSLFIYIT